MARLFGTDGVRGLANGELTPALALSVPAAAARVLLAHARSPRRGAPARRARSASGRPTTAAIAVGAARVSASDTSA